MVDCLTIFQVHESLISLQWPRFSILVSFVWQMEQFFVTMSFERSLIEIFF